MEPSIIQYESLLQELQFGHLPVLAYRRYAKRLPLIDRYSKVTFADEHWQSKSGLSF